MKYNNDLEIIIIFNPNSILHLVCIFYDGTMFELIFIDKYQYYFNAIFLFTSFRLSRLPRNIFLNLYYPLRYLAAESNVYTQLKTG